MNEIQLQAAFILATNKTVVMTHSLMANIRSNEPWEFDGNLAGWIQSHVISAPEQSEAAKVIQGCIESMGNELKACFTDNLANNLI